MNSERHDEQDVPANNGDSKRPRISLFEETHPAPIEIPSRSLRRATRRDFVLYGLGAAVVTAAFWSVLPQETETFHVHDDSLPTPNANSLKERLLNTSLQVDDAVASKLYSPTRLVPIYERSQATPHLRNNYNGQTPDATYLDDWKLTVRGSGLAFGANVTLDANTLRRQFAHVEQVTMLVCVEGWSAIAWWGGFRFSDLIKAYPPKLGYAWIALKSDVNLDSDGNSDPYYVSIDMPTAMHPQTLLATHLSGKLLDVDHGAPLRLVAPAKLGLKNIKAITSITYTKERPADYWAERGYSEYDGI